MSKILTLCRGQPSSDSLDAWLSHHCKDLMRGKNDNFSDGGSDVAGTFNCSTGRMHDVADNSGAIADIPSLYVLATVQLLVKVVPVSDHCLHIHL